MKNLLLAFLLFVTSISFSQKAVKRQIAPTQIDEIFTKWNKTDRAGIVVGVLSEGHVIYTKGYGMANLEHRIPIGLETKFYIGDIAKEFTVYALLLLEENGQIHLKDDIRKYIPQLKSFPNAISIEQLIHHTSGLNNHDVSKALAGWRPEDEITRNQAYKLLQNQAKYIPESGNKQLPTDAGFMILEDLIANVSGLSYVDFITKKIFEPLEMTSSVFDTNGAVIANKAQGYFWQKNEFVSSNMNQTHTSVSDVYTTIGNMCLWAQELENPKVGTKQMMKKFDGLSVVNGKAIDETNLALYTGGHRFWNYRGARKLSHIEVAGGYACKLIRYPEHQLSVIVMGNDGAYNGSEATAASALYLEDFLESHENETSKIDSKELSIKQLKQFEGDYWDLDNHNTRKLHVSNDTLRYFRGPDNESALVPLSKNSFKMITWGDVEVKFDSKSTPKTIEVIQGESTSNLLAFDKNAEWAKDLNVFKGNYYAAALDTYYSFTINQGKLIITHSKLDPITLNPRIPDLFTSDSSIYSSIAFKRNENGDILGFQLATQGIENIWFQKETTSKNYAAKTE
ncbi:MAG: serine hydrolase domain-containing protein [Ekhidna sp.]